MKKLYLIALAAAAAMSASAAESDWVLFEDFENTPATPGLWDYMGGTPSGTVSVETVATEDNASNQAAKFSGGNYNSALEIEIALPEGKTIADYKAIDFDIYNFDMEWKSIFVYIDGSAVREPNGNDEGAKGKWKHFTYDLNLSGTSSTIKLAVGFKIKSNSFALDNIRLQEKGEAVAPGTYDETQNGTVTNGWLMLQDYQTKVPGDNAAIWGHYGSVAGTATVAQDPAAATNLMAEYQGDDYNTYFEVSAVLPEGKTLKDYKTIAFDIYRFDDDDNYKKMLVFANDAILHEDENYIEQAKAGVWTTKSYTIPEDCEIGASFLLHFGINSNKAHYAVDNVRLEERESSTPPVEPGTYDETRNGTVADGWYMAQDYQTKAPGDEAAIWGRYDKIVGTAAVAQDPTAATNLMAEFQGGDYNTYFEVNVALPEGKTLKDYQTVAFDIYRFDDDDNYKKMLVFADNAIIHEDENYIEQAKAGVWTTKSYAIPEDCEAGATFALRFGISSNKAHYAVDNVRLEERETVEAPAEIVDFTYEAITSKATVASLDYVLHVANHKEDTQYSVTLTLKNENGVEVSETNEEHSLVEEAAIMAPARAAATHRLSGTVGISGLTPQMKYIPTVSYGLKGAEPTASVELPAITMLTTGIEDVTMDGNETAEYFNLQGVRVAQPEAGRIYIVRRGAKVAKELVK